MIFLKKPTYDIKENEVTDERLFNKRRDFIKLGAASIVSTGAIVELLAKEEKIIPDLNFTPSKNPNNLKLNTYEQITSYNNFYEFTTSKEGVKPLSKNFNPTPWDIVVEGLVEKDFIINMDDILKKFALEERIYRFRCVEGWSMVVPWIGFRLSDFIKYCKPTSKAKYIRFETLYDPEQFPDQNKGIFSAIDYPYVEGLRMDEAMNDLTILAVGLYGKKMPNQNGAPLRLIVPWKYGFKSIKSIVKIEFVEHEPLNTWQQQNPKEYGFYANVNPEVDHPRWSQARERVLGEFFKKKTLPFNGYADEVASLYKDMDLRKNF